jgi:hypothetical protein
MAKVGEVYDTKEAIKHLKDGIASVGLEFILDTATLENHIGNFSHDNDIARDIVWKILEEATGEQNIYKICEKACTQDAERTKFLNSRYNDVYMLPKRIKPEYQKLAVQAMQKILDQKEVILKRLLEEEAIEEKQEQEFKDKYSIASISKLTEPKGGEEGIDGFSDVIIADVKKEYRFFERNVFDFGYYNYPQRVNGTNDVFHQETWTEEEREISKWLNKYGPLKNKSMRM